MCWGVGFGVGSGGNIFIKRQEAANFQCYWQDIAGRCGKWEYQDVGGEYVEMLIIKLGSLNYCYTKSSSG